MNRSLVTTQHHHKHPGQGVPGGIGLVPTAIGAGRRGTTTEQDENVVPALLSRVVVRRNSGPIILVLGGLLTVCLAGCLRPDATRFYLLSSPAGEAGAGPAAAVALVGLLPVQVPVYLDVPQLVVRRTPTEMEVRDFHRWAEPLSTSVARALRDGMEEGLGPASVPLFPWPVGPSPATTVRVELRQFDGDLTGLVRLRALVEVRRSGHDVASTGLVVEEQAASAASDELVAAMGRAVRRLATEVVELVRDSAGASDDGG